MRFCRGSLRILAGRAALAAWALVTLGLGSACGAGAATPTATAVPGPSASTAPAASPQRPALASPAASPSAVVASTASTPTATAEGASESYEVQSGDTLLSIAQQFYQDPTEWRRVYDANKDTIGSDPDKLKIGMKLTIPPKQ